MDRTYTRSLQSATGIHCCWICQSCCRKTVFISDCPARSLPSQAPLMVVGTHCPANTADLKLGWEWTVGHSDPEIYISKPINLWQTFCNAQFLQSYHAGLGPDDVTMEHMWRLWIYFHCSAEGDNRHVSHSIRWDSQVGTIQDMEPFSSGSISIVGQCQPQHPCNVAGRPRQTLLRGV